MSETSTKPYLIRALHEWCTDNGYTPHLAVTVDERATVPHEHVKNGEIVLNVGRLATNKLELGNEFIEFQARFGGVARQISVPVDAVTAIYARETGHGMAFEITGAKPGDDKVADGSAGAESSVAETSSAGTRPQLSAVPSEATEGGQDGDASSPPDDTDPPTPAGPDRGRPKLTIIK